MSQENRAEYPAELAFLHTQIQQIDEITDKKTTSPFAEATDKEQHQQGRMYFRQGYQTANSKTRKLFIVLRGLPGCGAEAFGRGIMSDAVVMSIKTMTMLSTDDFFLDKDGKYMFDKDRLTEYHRLNYKKAMQHFINDTELVILNNYNIKKAHYRHYVTVAQSLSYVIAEMTVGTRTPNDQEVMVYSRNTEGRVPESVIRKYAKTFEV